jgi:hypothetical protein
VNLDSATSSGSTAGYAKNWTVPYDGNDCSYTSGYIASYNTYTFTATTTEEYDVEVFFYTTASFYSVIALYAGTFPAVSGGTTDPCNGTLIVVDSYYYNYAYLPRVAITTGLTYTVVVSGDSIDSVAPYGIFVTPTKFGDTSTSQANYVAPDFDALSVTTDCVVDASKQWAARTWTAEFPVVIIDTGRESTFDTGSVLYSGNVANPPDTCTSFIAAGDTGDGGPLSAIVTVGSNFTVVVTGYGSGSGLFSLYALSGTPLGIETTTGSLMSSPASIIVTSFGLIIAALALVF